MGITWDSSMATGVDSVDDQHKVLIGRLDALLAAMAAGRGRDEIEPILGALREYAGTHFSHEEDCMRRWACPVASQNIAAHRQFVATFDAIDREFRSQGASSGLVIRVQKELADWISQHIRRTDTALRSCAKPA